MKRAIYYISFILSMLITTLSCADAIIETGEGDKYQGKEKVPIALNISGLMKASTYGTDYDSHNHNTDDVPGTVAENAVGHIIVYIFDDSYTCEKILIGTANPVGPEMVTTGTKHFLAVVNSDTACTGSQALPLIESAVNYNDLRRSLTDEASALPTSRFLMVGEKHNVPVTTIKPISDPNIIELEVERVCAKVTMQFTKSALATGHNITLQKVTLYKGADKVYLFTKPVIFPIHYNLTASSTAFQSGGVVPDDTASIPYIHLLDTFYTYAADIGPDTTKAVRFEIEADINGNTRTASFYLAEYTPPFTTDTLYDIRRNYWYNVKVNMIDPGMDSLYLTVIASRWNIGDPQVVIQGEGYELVRMASPFRLVKFINDDQMTNFSTSAAIESHPKGAAWFDLKVSAGTTWSLSFKGGLENADAWMSMDKGAHWYKSLTDIGLGTDSVHIFVYRPYVENAEPVKGPTLELYIEGNYTRDIVVQGRDIVPFPTNSFILRPRLTGVPINDTRVYIPLNEAYSYWEDYLLPVGDTISRVNITADLLWKDVTGEVIIPVSISLINEDRRDGYLYLEAGAVQGNAVVVLKSSGIPFWSYHLWVTEYNPYEPAGQKLYSGTKTVFMDRNLGAMSKVYDVSGEERGLYYQFGRKDPFPFAAFDLGGGPITMNTGTATSTSLFPNPPEAIPEFMRDPFRFCIINSGDPWPLSVEDNDLWETTGGNKTAYDPCPEGWRVPKQEGIYDSPWDGLTFPLLPEYPHGRYDETVGYYPYAGYLTGPGSVISLGTEAYFWSAWKGTNNQGTGLEITVNSVSMLHQIDKYHGISVRCVVDDTYLMNVENGGKFGKYAADLMNSIQ